ERFVADRSPGAKRDFDFVNSRQHLGASPTDGAVVIGLVAPFLCFDECGRYQVEVPSDPRGMARPGRPKPNPPRTPFPLRSLLHPAVFKSSQKAEPLFARPPIARRFGGEQMKDGVIGCR